jgi:glycosyltransferase involved in cell wall biosynthesis
MRQDLNSASVVHLVSWYPSRDNPFRATFIKSHFRATLKKGRHKLIHVEALYRKGFPSLCFGKYSEFEKYRLIFIPTKNSFITELITIILIFFVRVELGKRWWDGVHVHIAWPILRFPRVFSLLFGNQILIGEHWSAYHSSFNLKPNTRAMRNMQSMFSLNLPITVVSKALAMDIKKFAPQISSTFHIIPNVVDSNIFFPPNHHRKPTRNMTEFLMVANWAPIKLPFLVLNAAKELAHKSIAFRVNIVGEGAQISAMREFTVKNNLEGHISFLGSLDSPHIAMKMREVDAFLHPSAYETFSLVCAEALCCGLPIFFSDLPAIREFVDIKHGTPVSNTQDSWLHAMSSFISQQSNISANVSKNASQNFSPKIIGEMFNSLYCELWK